MTKEQADAKLAVLPLTTSVTTYYSDFYGEPYLAYEFTLNGSVNSIQLPINPNITNIQDLANHLPLAAADRLASLAILLAPALPSNG